MKIKNLFIGLGMVCLAQATMAQGLEGIIVERYYQADATDAQYTIDQGYTYPLSSGAVTYRVYVDMAAGYKFVQMFGTPTKNLLFNTTTSFYNDENYDSQTGPTTSVLNTKKHTTMLDSWITAGGAAGTKVGVLKDEDTDGSIANPHTHGLLNNNPGGCYGSGIVGATGKDGMMPSSGTTYTAPNVLGMGGSILNALTAGNNLGSITVSNGSIAALGGIVGATSTNKVLIGQFTTTGVFTFSINVQLLSPTGAAENYVYGTPGAGQLTNATLIRTAPGAPSVVIASSDADNNICANASVTFTATPTNGGTPSYQWKVNGNNAGTDAATFVTTTLANNDVVTVVMTAGGCDAAGSATSNGITTVVNANSSYYADADNDTYGAGAATVACVSPGAGYVTNNTDCDDANASVNPTGTEVCGNSIDEDCSGSDLACVVPGCMNNTACNYNASATVDNGSCTFATTWYLDADGDGYYVSSQSACANPGAGYTATVGTSGDCNDNNASIHAGVSDICGNGIDEDCSGADLTCPSSGGISGSVSVATVGNYGTGAQTNLSANLTLGTNSIESPGVGNDLWFQFVAQYNAVRIALSGSSAVADDNDLGLYNNPVTTGIQLVPISVENDVHPGAQGAAADGGSETLLYDQLTVGNTYYICVRNNNATPGATTLNISYLRGSQNEIGAFTGNTNAYSNTCSNFKVAFRSGALNYTVNRWASSSMSGVPVYSYTIPSGTITQLGRIVPANLSGVAQTIYTSVNVAYSLPDAFGNISTLTANGTVNGAFTLNSMAAVTVRSSDQCAATFKSITSAVVTDKGVCGANIYNWQFTQAFPIAGLPMSINGATGGSRILALASVPGMANGQRYDVKVRPLHFDGVSYSDFASSPACVKTIGAAGMVLENNNDFESVSSVSDALLFPNPNNGAALNLVWSSAKGQVEMSIYDQTGSIVSKENFFVENGLNQAISFNNKLASGIYNVSLKNQQNTAIIRFVVSK